MLARRIYRKGAGCLTKLISRSFHASRVRNSLENSSEKAIANSLGLQSYSASEISSVFLAINTDCSTSKDAMEVNDALISKQDIIDAIVASNATKTNLLDVVDVENARNTVHSMFDSNLTRSENNVALAKSSTEAFVQRTISLRQFNTKMISVGEKLDSKVYTVGGSCLLTGSSMGIIFPCMPLLIQELQISPTAFGLVVSSFGFAKLLGNIPAAFFVEQWGRKPMMVMGLGLCGVGIGGIGICLLPALGDGAIPLLFASRFMSGLGVSCFYVGAHMFVADVSTPLNRTRTMAPIMSGFQAGAAIGPAIGGYMLGFCGLPMTYLLVSGLVGGITIMNQKILEETKPRFVPRDGSMDTIATAATLTAKEAYIGVKDCFSVAGQSWRRLLSTNKTLAQLSVLQLAYWFVLSGTQMTMLPMLLVDPEYAFHLTSLELGSTFAYMSVVNVISAQPIAYIADKMGKVPLIVVGAGLIGGSICGIPAATGISELLGWVTPLCLGGSILSSVPIAYLNDLVTAKDRAQAQSLLRSAGDVGFLAGAGSAGAMAAASSIGTTMKLDGALLIGVMAWYASTHMKTKI